MDKHTLLVKYLELIAEQENTINELSKSNIKLIKRNNDLIKQEKLYKENAIYWKNEHDKLQRCLIDIKVRCTNIYEEKAIRTYKEMQGV